MTDERDIEGLPGGLEGWREVWSRNLWVRSRLVHRLLRPVLEKILVPFLSLQRNYNLALLEMLEDQKRDLQQVRQDLLGDLQALLGDLRRVEEKLPTAVQRNDAIYAALDQKIETVASRVRDLSLPLLASGSPSFRSDFVYRRLEDGLRGGSEVVREALRPYLELARQRPPVIDVGCGRGEFLRMCREEGIPATGFDTNERSVAELVSEGLPVELEGVPGCLSRLPSSSTGSILASHLVEHLPADVLIALFVEAARVLVPGGFLMIETPNAQALATSASEFWRDPTHIAPRHVGALVLVGRELGFEVHEVTTVHPHSDEDRLSISPDHPTDLREVVRRLDELLFGDQDLRLILRKGE